MKTGHGVIQGYNGQTMKVITTYIEEKYITADKTDTDAYIPDQNFRKRGIRFKTKRRHIPHNQDPFVQDNFSYSFVMHFY
jgi:hypothetical protein